MTTPHSRQPICVFISYSRADSARIDRLEAELIGYGFHTWVDRDQLEGGQHWATQIERAIQGCDALLVGLSPEAVASPWVTDELLYTRQLGKPIIPVLLRPVEVIPLLLVALQYIDLSTDEQQGIQQVRLRLLQSGSHAPSPQPSVAAASSVTRRIAPTAQAHMDDPTTTLVLLPPPTPAADLNDLFTQGIAAWAHGDLDLAETTLRQVVERDPQFGAGVAAQQLAAAQRQLLPIQVERLRVHAIAAEAQGAWGEAINAWQTALKLAPDNAEARECLTIDQQNQQSAWLYSNVRSLLSQGDLGAASQMWQVLQQQAPHYGDPDHLQRLLPIGTLLTTFNILSPLITRMVAWAPDSQRIAGICDNETPQGQAMAVQVWNATSGRVTATCGSLTKNQIPTTFVWSPDSQRIAVSSSRRDESKYTTQVWETMTGQLLASHEGYGAAWAADNERIATSNTISAHEERTDVWEAMTGKTLVTIQGGMVAWAPDGRLISTSNLRLRFLLWWR